MTHETDSFFACESLIRRYSPLLLLVGEQEPRRETSTRLIGEWRPRIHRNTIIRMKNLRAQGMTIGDIARKTGVSWRTAWRLSK